MRRKCVEAKLPCYISACGGDHAESQGKESTRGTARCLVTALGIALRAAVIIVDNDAEGARRRGKWTLLKRGEP
ncbi:MAG: hypothetical protein MK538_09455 [Planctomycetes bacterium]|nr:hypothetical protein [Planctomycetota bacterium]